MSRRSEAQSSDSITIKEVAKRAGVSIATVSRVLAGQNGAGSEVRERVLETVRQLNYQPNRIARNLRVRNRKIAGVVIPDLQNPFFTGIVQGIEEVLNAQGYTLLLANSDERIEREKDHIQLLRAEGVSGLLLIPSSADPRHYDDLRKAKLPVVTIDRSPAGLAVDSVKTANVEGAREAVAHLVAIGHSEIGVINGPEHYDVARERLMGVKMAMNDAGRSLRDEWVIHGDFRPEGGYNAVRRMLSAKTQPKAVFVTNNLMTLGALQAIHESRLKIPRDIAIVSFDDMPWAMSLNPPLTAVAQPAREIGRTAAQLLLERYEQPDRPIHQVTLQPRLIIRSSCGAKNAPK